MNSADPDPNPNPASERSSDEVARRVRRAVGFKVMRDFHKLADAQQREDQQRPLLLLKLLVIVAAVALAAFALSQWL